MKTYYIVSLETGNNTCNFNIRPPMLIHICYEMISSFNYLSNNQYQTKQDRYEIWMQTFK